MIAQWHARYSFSGDVIKEPEGCGKRRAALQEGAVITFYFTHEARLQVSLRSTAVVRSDFKTGHSSRISYVVVTPILLKNSTMEREFSIARIEDTWV